MEFSGGDERLRWGRLYMLEEQCNTWGGITSVAVYLPLIYFQASNGNKLQEAISHVEDFHEQIDRTHGALSGPAASQQPCEMLPAPSLARRGLIMSFVASMNCHRDMPGAKLGRHAMHQRGCCGHVQAGAAWTSCCCLRSSRSRICGRTPTTPSATKPLHALTPM